MKRIWEWTAEALAGWLKVERPVAPPPFPIDPASGSIDLPSDTVHELFHLVRRGGRAEAAWRERGSGRGVCGDVVATAVTCF